MIKVIFDSSFLISMVDRGVYPGQVAPGVDAAVSDRRIEHMLVGLEANRTIVVIPTPVLAEVLVKRLQQASNLVATIKDASRIRLAPFGASAAIEAAELLHKHLPKKTERNKEWSKHRLKFDLQILAIAKVEGVARIYANDKGLLRRVRSEGMEGISLNDLATPEEDAPRLPMELPKNGPRSRRNVDPDD